jgi:hypothetical protein
MKSSGTERAYVAAYLLLNLADWLYTRYARLLNEAKWGITRVRLV